MKVQAIEMKMRLKAPLVALALAIGAMGAITVTTGAHAGSNTALQRVALRQACTDQGGRFETSWMYNDQGAQWGRVLSCVTSARSITCQGNVCRVKPAGRPVTFSAALASLSGK